jgi:chromosomal replication initiator protein
MGQESGNSVTCGEVSCENSEAGKEVLRECGTESRRESKTFDSGSSQTSKIGNVSVSLVDSKQNIVPKSSISMLAARVSSNTSSSSCGHGFNHIESLASGAQRAGLFPAVSTKRFSSTTVGGSTVGGDPEEKNLEGTLSSIPSAHSPASQHAIAIESDLVVPQRLEERELDHIVENRAIEERAKIDQEFEADTNSCRGNTITNDFSSARAAHSPAAQNSAPSPLELWMAIGTALSQELDSQIFEAYLAPLKALRFIGAEQQLVIGCPSRFISTQVSRAHGKRLGELLALNLSKRGLDSSKAEVVFEVCEFEARRFALDTQPKSISVNAVAPGNNTVSTAGAGNQHADRLSPNQSISRVSTRSDYVPVLKNPTGSQRFDGKGSDRKNNSGAGLGANLQPSVSTKLPIAESGAAPENSGLHSRYTFSSFVVGSSNQFCHAAALRVSEAPGQSYNPLFMYGGVGLGKTHLLHAIGHAVLQRNPDAQILYLSSEAFTNELILALRHAKMDEFKSRLRSIDLLLIDDIQFMIGKERTQEEFFHTFNALYNAKKQIVITSDKIPQEFPGMEERLITRFSWGLTADLQAPDFETRVAIINRKAAQESFSIPKDVAHFVAEHVSSNVRELEGALTRLHALSSIQNVPISNELAQVALRHLLQPKAVRISIDDIKKAVAQHFGIKPADIISKRRTKNLSFPRHIAMYLCRKHTTASYPEIGSQFGGRDHSSVIHAASVVSVKISTDKELKEILGEIEKRLLGSNF